MIYFATASGVTAYNDKAGINQSSLKKIIPDPMFFSEKEPEMFYEEKDWKIVGNGVDINITQGKASFEQQYYQIPANVNKPSDTVLSILNQLYSELITEIRRYPTLTEPVSRFYTDYARQLTPIFNSHQYYPNRFKSDENWQADTRINELNKKPECEDYWNALCDANGRLIISQEESIMIETIYKAILTHPHTASIFSLPQNNPNYDLVFQFPLSFTYAEVLCKGLMDILLINHISKKIYPLDIKTSGKYFLYQFPNAIREHRYDFQAAFYTEGLTSGFNLLELGNIVKRHVADYAIQNFGFITVSTKNPTVPAIFNCDDSLLHIGKYGRKEVITDGIVVKQAIEGFDSAIEKYKYYCANGFKMNHIFKNNGRVNVNWEGVI